jgi:phosphatidylinositol-3,4,5-trisphosphate 3-phosphatase/dual-specificity protein phosphatase PTEN
MYRYLSKNPKRVVVVHCNAGKGRTGTSISWFLMYSGLAQNAEEAIRYYGRKRFTCGQGVTQPSQVRYVKYFEQIFFGITKSPTTKVLKSVKVTTVPHMNGKSWKPYLEIERVLENSCVYSGKNSEDLKSFRSKHKVIILTFYCCVKIAFLLKWNRRFTKHNVSFKRVLTFSLKQKPL